MYIQQKRRIPVEIIAPCNRGQKTHIKQTLVATRGQPHSADLCE